MTILIVRHGETPLNRTRVVQPADTPLSDLGQRQATRVAERLQRRGIGGILVSDLSRARMTAKPIEARAGIVAEVTPLLQERNFGDLRGTPYAALTENIFAPDYAPPAGETWEVFRARVAEAWALAQARAAALEGVLVVVTHGLVCRALGDRHLTWAEGDGPPEYWHNTGVTEVERSAPHQVRLGNCVAHLDADDREPTTVSGL